jgi:uncharacterized protein YjfI (DUF2170 family)
MQCNNFTIIDIDSSLLKLIKDFDDDTIHVMETSKTIIISLLLRRDNIMRNIKVEKIEAKWHILIGILNSILSYYLFKNI